MGEFAKQWMSEFRIETSSEVPGLNFPARPALQGQFILKAVKYAELDESFRRANKKYKERRLIFNCTVLGNLSMSIPSIIPMVQFDEVTVILSDDHEVTIRIKEKKTNR